MHPCKLQEQQLLEIMFHATRDKKTGNLKIFGSGSLFVFEGSKNNVDVNFCEFKIEAVSFPFSVALTAILSFKKDQKSEV